MKKLAILTPNPFPIGNVATNRFTTYAKVIANMNFIVDVLVLKGTEDRLKKYNNKSGVYMKINYFYMGKDEFWNTGWARTKKLLMYLFGVILTTKKLKNEKYDSVVMYTNDWFYMIYFGILSKFFGYRYLIDKSEYPVSRRYKNLILRRLYNFGFYYFDGFIVMTKELNEFYKKISNKKAQFIHVPMSVDFDRFGSKYHTDPFKITCVFGVHNRDCIEDTISAFDIFYSKFDICNYELNLVGDFDKIKDREKIKSLLNACKSKINIKICGVVGVNEIPSVIGSSGLLVTTPRAYDSGGFPTKLGEYLASARPVVLTKIGELGDYLTDNVNCFFAEPGNVEHIAELMYSFHCNKTFYNKIGFSGMEAANKYFNIYNYRKELGDFIFNKA